ncbi:hypothetical protein C6A86_026795 [Mycobacterium sp. ITM-2016-00316]|uniref:ApeA N-terminal domain 1-containing protein n=1 Tax=Mycobacterium sp. ITM-2016-00316 TaxID=2099695 RepID=UPI00115974C3|nr:HEPN domain-containing protein [Mycobacterium sp. ITM-2016-00316]WNG81723.1 hypothetical protein C6A86_026795 [Mycobacterium sp. ITM-2016-00316]
MSSDDLTSMQTWRGTFWLPDKSDESHEGFLTYEPEYGVTLKFVSGFDDRTRTAISPTGYSVTRGSGRFPLIHGSVEGSTPVTLVDCRAVRRRSGWATESIRNQDISAALVLIGVLLNRADDPEFCGLSIELENLTEWDRHDEMTIFVDPSEDSPRRENWRVHVNPMQPLSASVGDLTIKLVRQYRQPRFDVRRDRLETTATAFTYLKISASRPKSMDEWFEVAKAFQDLVTLAMDAPCALLSESLIPSKALLDRESARAREAIDVFGEHILQGERDLDGVANRDALFTLGSEGVDFAGIVSEWLRIHADFRTTCDMIFGMKYVRGGYLQTELITAVAAAESLHSALKLPPPVPDKEFDERRKRLMECIPKDQREWLHRKLGANEHTLRQRLIDLAKIPYPDIIAEILPNPEAWAKAAKDERNAVAHGGQRMTRDVPLLNAIVTTTTAVVFLNLLQQLQIPAKRVKIALEQNRTLKSAKYLAREHWPAPKST